MKKYVYVVIEYGFDNINCNVMYDKILKVFINHEKAIDFIRTHVSDMINSFEWSEETNYDQVGDINDIKKYVETESGYRIIRDYDTNHWIKLLREEVEE